MLAATAPSPPQPALGPAPSARRRPNEAPALALLAGAIDLAVGIHINLGLHYIESDAFSRVANAFYVLYSRTPHLAAIGFVWNPLPSLLELLLIPLKVLWPPLVTSGLASAVVSAAFGGLAVYLLLCILWDLGLPLAFRAAAGLLFAANPLILLYGANGMTGIMLIATMLGTLRGVLRYLERGSLRSLTAAALWLAVGFVIRYEAAPFGALLGLALLVVLRWKGTGWSRIEAALLIFAAPLVYVSGLWLYLNWLVMKNPLFFMDGTYSNAAISGFGAYGYPLLSQLKGHPLHAAGYVAGFALLFWPVIPAALFAVIQSFGRRRDARMPVLLAATAAVPLLQFALLYRGLSSGVDRYFMYYIPMGFLLIGLFAAKLPRARWRWAPLAALALVLALGDAGTGYALAKSPILGHGDGPDVVSLYQGRVRSEYVARDKVVAYLNAHPDLTVLADSAFAFPIILRVRNPRQLIISSDSAFNSILRNPRGRVDAFLVPAGPADQPNAVANAWPGISSGKISWLHAFATFAGGGIYELYRVGPNAP